MLILESENGEINLLVNWGIGKAVMEKCLGDNKQLKFFHKPVLPKAADIKRHL